VTQIFQLLVIAAGVAGLVIYGVIRDKQEHPPKNAQNSPLENDDQGKFVFATSDEGADDGRRGAAMSRL
jgi:hypothetical protein